MKIDANTKLDVLLSRYPFLVDFLAELSPDLRQLKSRILRKTMAKVATLEKVASMGKIEVEQLMNEIAREVLEKANEVLVIKVEVFEEPFEEPKEPIEESKEHIEEPKEPFEEPREPIEEPKEPFEEPKEPFEEPKEQLVESDKRQEVLKEIIRGVHEGEDMNVLKNKFRELIKDVDPSEISKMEQQLIDEGIPEEEVKRLCDVHVEIFKESLDKKEIPTAPPGHPVHTFMKENREAEKIMDEIEEMLKRLGDPPNETVFLDCRGGLGRLLESFAKIDYHYLRKENQLFPMLESHDVSGPSQVMWGIHDDVRTLLKKASELLSQEEPTALVKTLKELIPTTREMIYKEEHILFPMSLEQLSQSEWTKVRSGEEEIGYAWVEPEEKWPPEDFEMPKEVQILEIPVKEQKIPLATGALSKEQIDLILTHLPVDISFVDETDRVAYYSATKERIFPRSPAVIRRKVQKCHPSKSVDTVQKILNQFKAGYKDVAEFWLQLDGKFIHIRYFAVRDSEGIYKGTLEVSQDVTDIKKLEGENRLLDWE